MTGSDDVRIRSYAGPADDEPLRRLFRAAFGLERGADYFHWKYRANPAGPARISLAELDGRPVSVACVLPVRMVMRGRALLGALSVDVATDPALRGRGLYRRTAEHLWSGLGEQGVAFTFGFTNRYSTRLTLEVLGRREIGPLPVRVRPLRALALALATAVRDARQLQWRYADHPERPYEILARERYGQLSGYVIWRLLDRFGTRCAFVADVAADPNQPADAALLLEAVGERARARGATLLSLLSWSGCPLDHAARHFAFLPVPRWLFPQVNVISVISHREPPSTASLADPTRWWLAWGDSDVV